jgi:MFS superfamily sulfate permease-like transporter
VSIEVGTLIAVGMSLLLVINHSSRTRFKVLGRVTSPGKVKYEEHGNRVPGCMIIQISESLFFGNSGMLKDRLKRVEMFGTSSVHPSSEFEERQSVRVLEPLRCVILDVGAVTSVDASAMHNMLEIVRSYIKQHVNVCFVKVRGDVEVVFERAGLYGLVARERCGFRKIRDALIWEGFESSLEGVEEGSVDALSVFDDVLDGEDFTTADSISL